MDQKFQRHTGPAIVADSYDALKDIINDEIRAQSPLNRVAKPEEVARTALWLASSGNDFLTGSIIDVNGASYFR